MRSFSDGTAHVHSGGLGRAPRRAARRRGAASRKGVPDRVSVRCLAGTLGPLCQAFLQELRELGYVDGRNIVLEYRFAQGNIGSLRDLAAELVQLNADVIVTSGGVPATNAAKQATRSIPIVMAEAGDAVGTGLVVSFARPGENVTGLSTMDPDITSKRLQLLKEVAPRISRVAVLYHSMYPATVLGKKDAQVAGPALGLTALPIELRSPDELDNAFATITRRGADSLLTFGDPFSRTHQRRILDWAAEQRLPAMHFYPDTVHAGGLMAYGPSLPDMYRRAATYVDRILKGAKPADLSVERPTKFEFVINLKTAKALGLTIPQSLLLRADRVIE
jgi:putative ABC transport system substrate-binding protein